MPWRRDVAIDLGTAFIRVAMKDLGIVTIPAGMAVRPPLRCGVVADPFEVANILRPLLCKVKKMGMGLRVVVGTPSDTNGIERKALLIAMRAAGADDIEIIPETQAAAIGAGMEVGSPYAHMIVDMGEGVTDCAIIRAGEILYARAVRIGCCTLRESVQAGYRQRWGTGLTQREAEQLLEKYGVGREPCPSDGNPLGPDIGKKAETHGMRSATIHALVEPYVAEILSTINDQLRTIPHDLGCEVIESGIVLTGGGALLPGMSERLSAATAINVAVPASPLDVVIRGILRMQGPAAATRA